MNPWYEQLVDDCLAEHDRGCLDGAECPKREDHTMKAYVTVALRERVETLQGQMGRVRDVHTGTVWPGVADKPICDACDQMWPCATIRALD